MLSGQEVVNQLRGNHALEAICVDGVYDGGTLSYQHNMGQFWLNFRWDDGDPIPLDGLLLSCKWKLTSSVN